MPQPVLRRAGARAAIITYFISPVITVAISVSRLVLIRNRASPALSKPREKLNLGGRNKLRMMFYYSVKY